MNCIKICDKNGRTAETIWGTGNSFSYLNPYQELDFNQTLLGVFLISY